MADNLEKLLQQIDDAPTVQAGLIVLLTNIRHRIEAEPDSEEAMVELAKFIDDNSPVLADAVINNTPAQAAHEERAAVVEEEADGVDAGVDPA